MQDFEMKAISKDEWALIELVRSSLFQKITAQVNGGKIVNLKKEESFRPDRYQPKLVPSN